MFVDRVQINVNGGNGGNGCLSFSRQRCRPKGGPNGGNGGNGGSIIFQVSEQEQSLETLQSKHHYRAENGQHGKGKNRHGRQGKDRTIKLPIGTLIKDIDQDHAVLADLDTANKEYIAARGGNGGYGNAHYRSSINQAPQRYQYGSRGEERHLELELKILADIGLVGYPNAGKSTLLNSLSNAKSPSAAYQFTTRFPYLGILEYDDYERIRVADIPGLIKGASQNMGMGYAFLRHIERSKILVYVIDIAGVDGRTPWNDLDNLRQELEAYQKKLSQDAKLIIANKIDQKIAKKNLSILKNKTHLEIIPISALHQQGIKHCLIRLRTVFAEAKSSSIMEKGQDEMRKYV